ncbi:ectomycorrhiza-regulated small secreted protein [Crepidotus variabilis]|uniref:Ectomycorrhiza-regulated small secreted protein n=1 Tax=Crepidotus variabilis TaxID=179855 RepID=A0A9P6EKB7_9AGAR|nr:ectomycorrhiza-regulated small secreted protein [Crepidotus variabilis]
MSSEGFYLHSLLRYYQRGVIPGRVSPLQWDIREVPETARRIFNRNDLITAFHLIRPSTSPPMIVFRVISGIFPEPWPIEIRKLEIITIGDVLHAIHSALMRPLRRDEWERLCDKQRSRIEAVFEERCDQAQNADECRSRGVLRVDCLLKHTLFGGLSISPEEDCTSILTLRRV